MWLVVSIRRTFLNHCVFSPFNAFQEQRQLDQARQTLLASGSTETQPMDATKTYVATSSSNTNTNIKNLSMMSSARGHQVHDYVTVVLQLWDGITRDDDDDDDVNDTSSTITTTTYKPEHKTACFELSMHVDTEKSITQNIQSMFKQQVNIITTPKPAQDPTDLKFYLFDTTDTTHTHPITETSFLQHGQTYLLTHDPTPDDDDTAGYSRTTLFILPDEVKGFMFSYVQVPHIMISVQTLHDIIKSVFKLTYNVTYLKLDTTSAAISLHKRYTRIITRQLKRGRPGDVINATPTAYQTHRYR